MKQSFSVMEVQFSNNISDIYLKYNQILSELHSRTVLDTILERRLLGEIDEYLKRVDISKEEFTRIALLFTKYSKVIFLVDYFEPIGKTLHNFLGFKSSRRCNIIFTYEIINSSIESVLYSKYYISKEELKRCIIIVPNTSSNYYNVLRNLSEKLQFEFYNIVFLTPQHQPNILNTDYVFLRGFKSSAVNGTD